MADFIITCPKVGCQQPLRLPAEAIGQPLSCPHCRTGIQITVDASGQVQRVVAIRTGLQVPRLLLVPAFAMIILGGASLFANSYIAYQAATKPGYAEEFARDRVNDLRTNEQITLPADKVRGRGQAMPSDPFGAVVGAAAVEAVQQNSDAAVAEGWEGYVFPYHLVFAVISLLIFTGGTATLFGRGYWLALIGSVACFLNINMMCCIPGAIVGIWGILMLVRDESRLHFGKLPRGAAR